MEEKELILACRAGDERAFEALVRLHEKRVLGLCRRMCRSEEDALEAAQDTFLALWRGIGDFRDEASLSTWLYRLASNACVDRLRRGKRYANDVSLDDGETRIDLVDGGAGPEEALERAETRRALQRGLMALPEDHREVLLLREADGLSYREIAEAAGLELGTVKSRISRARQALRNYLAADGNFFGAFASKQTEKRKEAERK